MKSDIEVCNLGQGEDGAIDDIGCNKNLIVTISIEKVVIFLYKIVYFVW